MIATTLIEIPQWGTTTLVEAVWLSFGLFALAVSGLRIRSLWGDYRDAIAIGEPDLYIIARGYLRREIIRITQSCCISSIGLYAAQAAPTVPGPAQISFVGLVLTGVLISVALLVALQSIFDWRDRTQIQRIIRGGDNR